MAAFLARFAPPGSTSYRAGSAMWILPNTRVDTILSVAASLATIAGFLVAVIKFRRRPKLRLRNFDPVTDGVVKPPEFSWAPAAWMRLEVANASGGATARKVQVFISRVDPDGPDDRPRTNLKHLPLKWADTKDKTLDISPGDKPFVDLAKLNAAWNQAIDEAEYRTRNPGHLLPRPGDVEEDRPAIWALVTQEAYDDRRHELTIGTEYDIELAVAARNCRTKYYTARLACEGWPSSPPWPYETADVWRSFRLVRPLTPYRPRRFPSRPRR